MAGETYQRKKEEPKLKTKHLVTSLLVVLFAVGIPVGVLAGGGSYGTDPARDLVRVWPNEGNGLGRRNPRARLVSRATMRNIRQNLFFAFVYNALGVSIAAGVLYPFLGVLLSPMIAAAAMSFSSVSVVGNALRLRGLRL